MQAEEEPSSFRQGLLHAVLREPASTGRTLALDVMAGVSGQACMDGSGEGWGTQITAWSPMVMLDFDDGVCVAQVSGEDDVGQAMVTQLEASPKEEGAAEALIALMGFVAGVRRSSRVASSGSRCGMPHRLTVTV